MTHSAIKSLTGLGGVSGWQLGRMVTSTRQGYELFERVLKYAQLDHSVLIIGESGVGMSLNCSALPSTLIKSQLFGHLRNAFTGATSNSPGAFGSADGSTLFMDEVGDLPADIQPKLLRALESNEITAVGSSHARAVDVRIVAATNRGLESLVDDGQFRADLFYRLQVLELEISPLRSRPQDICLLVPIILGALNCRAEIDREAIEFLQMYDWPGNVRELKNLLIRASVDCIHRIRVGDLQRAMLSARRPFRTRRGPRDRAYDYVTDELKQNGGNQKLTIERLGLPRTTFYRWLKEGKIHRPLCVDAHE